MERLTQKIKDHMQDVEVYMEKSRNIEINTGGDDFQDICNHALSTNRMDYK